MLISLHRLWVSINWWLFLGLAALFYIWQLPGLRVLSSHVKNNEASDLWRWKRTHRWSIGNLSLIHEQEGLASSFEDCTVDDLIAYRKVAKIIETKTVTYLGDLAVLSSFLYGRTFPFGNNCFFLIFPGLLLPSGNVLVRGDRCRTQ